MNPTNPAMAMPATNGNGMMHPSQAPLPPRAPPNASMYNQAMMNFANPSAVAHNRAIPMQNINPSMLTTLPHYSPSTQEILKRVSAPPPSAGTPEWEAARREVLKSMASNNNTHTAMHFPSAQGTRRTALGSGSAGQTTAVEAEGAAAAAVKPTRGRGGPRGRPRGSRARAGGRGGGRGGKRKREESDADEVRAIVFQVIGVGRLIRRL